MLHRTVVVVSAMLGVLMPGLARGQGLFGAPVDDIGVLSEQVETLAAAKDYAAAAKLAAAGATREDLDANTRVLLGGLARENFELSFAADHKLTDLCELAAVMRLVAPLDSKEGGALKLAVAADADARLKDAAGEAWQRVCEPPSAEAKDTGRDTDTSATSAAPETSVAERAVDVAPRQPRRSVARTNRSRMCAGLGTLVPGALLFAPLIGVLAYRGQGEAELQGLWDGARGRPWTAAEEARGAVLDQRHRETTAAAAVLGATGAALVVTGAVLVATGGRRSRVAVAPWGSRGVGGLVFAGRF